MAESAGRARTMTEADHVARIIREFFLCNGKWELDSEDWLWISDANYGFDPIELATRIMDDRGRARESMAG